MHIDSGKGDSVQDVISITGLHKKLYNGFKALEDINLMIKKGEIFALLDVNDAGKTSLNDIICWRYRKFGPQC